VTALAGCGGLIGDSSSDELGDELRIGVLAPEPESDPVGSSIAVGAQVAAAELEDNGGVLGADSVSVSVGNTESSASASRDAYNELILDNNVHFTLGNFSSEAALAIQDNIANERTIHMITGAGSPELTSAIADDYDRYKYIFRMGPFNSYYLGQSLVDFAAEFYQDQLGWDRTAILYEDAEWTPQVVEVVDSKLDNFGFTVTDTVSYSLSTKSFAPIYDDLQGDIDGVTTIMAHTGAKAAGQYNAQQRPFGFGGIHVPAQFPFMGSEGALGAGINDVWTQTTAVPTASITEKTGPFSEAFVDAHPDGQPPVYTGYLAYDAVKTYADYAEEVGSINEDDIIAAMEANELSRSTTTTTELEFYGPDEETEFGQFPHDLAYSADEWLSGDGAPVWVQWQDREQTVIQPEAHQQSSYQQR
jgi:branched-chain amino acid transport system substrate-binding protein